ncbi:MAG: biopolymer transporter ExbD [Erythrobacter sp.]|uniref:ExbD/TolR family protein n=1 Tax=Erythrobacter sp. TaxID=1042 RepID=UPI002626C2C2|nr:biopolymer transporter ExbD [Erythrobacter sp.]MDJ0979549.1 biopolymer transporter ExbD [Erythrobacter sp.]
MTQHRPAPVERPMSAMNMTPLIDVLLVLLIMFVMAVPVATHAVEVDTGHGPEVDRPIDPVRNKLVISGEDTLLWNGEAITLAKLQAVLEATTRMEPGPELQFEPDGMASYDLSARTLKVIKVAGVTKFGFVGNEKYRVLEREDD